MSLLELEVSYDHLSARELILNNIETIRTEDIPVARIMVEEALVDAGHVSSLKGSIQQKRGQISPITVRARLQDGEVVYDITDGFHRTNALKMLEKESGRPVYAHARVMYGCSDEELYDLRVLAVNSVASVKFARMAEWMQLSFQNTVWTHPEISAAIREGRLSLYQAFSVTDQNTSGRSLGLDPEQVVELKDWVLSKARYWDKPVSTLTMELRVVDMADPELVKQVRKGSGGQDRKGTLTFARLKEISTGFPKDHEIQRKIAASVIDNNITADRIPGIVTAIKRVSPVPASNGQATGYPSAVDSVLSRYSRERKPVERRAGRQVEPKVASKKDDELDGLEEMDLDQKMTLLRGVLEALLQDAADIAEDEATLSFAHAKIAQIRKWLGVDAIEQKLEADQQKKLVLLAGFETLMPLKDRRGREHTFDFKNRQIIRHDRQRVDLDQQEAVFLALRVIYGRRATPEMFRVELFGEDAIENQYLDSIVEIVERSLAAKLRTLNKD